MATFDTRRHAEDSLKRAREHEALSQEQVSGYLSESGEAKFAGPEALATGVAAGFILGPVGGLLLGAAQGILGKRMKQGELDAIAAEQMAYDDVDAAVMETIDRQMMEATTPEDVEQLNTMATQQTAARRMLASQVPHIQQQGAQLQSQLFEAQRSYAIKQEEQAIAADIRDETAERELGQENYSRFRTARDNFMTESANYLLTKNATENVIDALDRGSAVDQAAAIKLLERAIDPGGVTRPGDIEFWKGMGSALTRGQNFIEQIRSGKSMQPAQKEEFKDLVLSIEQRSYEYQQEREVRYQDEIEDIGLPVKYHDNFRLATPLPATASRPPADEPTADNGTPSAAELAAAAVLTGGDALNAVPSEVKTGAAAAAGISVAKWAPTLTKIAAKFGVPLAAVIAAGEQVSGESDEAYRHRLRRGMESTEYDERRRPTN